MSMSLPAATIRGQKQVGAMARKSASTIRATNLRSAASNSASPRALLASELGVEVLEVSEEWVHVRWETQTGWIPRVDLRFEEN